MRIVPIMISFGIGAYVVWKLGSPAALLPEPCQDKAGCVNASAVAASGVQLPGLRVELYDHPAIEPLMDAANDRHAPIRIATAEIPWIRRGEGRGPAPEPSPAAPSNVSLAGLGQPGAHGVCLALNGGSRRCVAFINVVAE